MNAPSRKFTASLAVRSHVPILVGLMGPSGGGKTYSALRLATGIQSVVGGDIYGVDTESRRMLHYADQFKFKHVPFEAPFGSLDYLEVLKFCAKSGAGVVIVDSMSHEHEGPGGLLDAHEQELNRLAGDNYGKRETMKMLAWGKPKADRRALINGLLQMNCNFIFCFRAKNTVKPVKVNGKTEVVPQGFMPIAGDEFVFEMTMNALLLPGADGFPTWESESVGEKTMIKLPKQFRALKERPRQIDEKLGVSLAKWAKGGESDEAEREEPRQQRRQEPTRAFQADHAGPADEPADDEPADQGGGFGSAPREDEEQAELSQAAIWAQGVRDDLEAGAFETAKQIDDLLTDPENCDLYAAYAKEAPAAAKKLEAALTGRRKALADRERRS